MVTRELWLKTMLKTADPVLSALSEKRLAATIPVDFHPDRAMYACLEAFGRTLCGMAPWLGAELSGDEEVTRREYLATVRKCLANAVDPEGEDLMNFTEGYGQSLVDAAFLAHAIVRAPKALYFDLPEDTRKKLVGALRSTRKFTPYSSNWLFFSAMIEIFLKIAGEDWDLAPVDRALDAFMGWYVGDGLYSDGELFHTDYYNSFVIHPMMTDILRELRSEDKYAQMYETELARAKRCAEILERLIMPDGSYPIIGRSSTYRYGAFHLLAQAALEGFLPDSLPPSQVRSALTAVIKRVHQGEIYDKNGWLLPGVTGFQPGLADFYISTGSLYLCETVFLPLGLPAGDRFWAEPDLPWTQKRVWAGERDVL